MWQFLEKAFLVILSLALCIFSFFVIEQVVLYTSKDYQYALIGALGSLIGGSLTLVGVLWTLKNQDKTAFINEFPKKIRNLEEIIIDMISIRKTGFIFNDILRGNRNAVYEQNVARMKVLATEVDGNCYFTIGKLDYLYRDYLSEKSTIPKIEPELRDEMGVPITRSKEMNLLMEKYENKIDEIISELEEYSKQLTDRFIKYKK